MLEPEHNAWTICHDVHTGVTTVRPIENEVVRRHEGRGIETGEWRESNTASRQVYPLSTQADIASKRQYSRGSEAFQTRRRSW
jgi:hypothetical protein